MNEFNKLHVHNLMKALIYCGNLQCENSQQEYQQRNSDSREFRLALCLNYFENTVLYITSAYTLIVPTKLYNSMDSRKF